MPKTIKSIRNLRNENVHFRNRKITMKTNIYYDSLEGENPISARKLEGKLAEKVQLRKSRNFCSKRIRRYYFTANPIIEHTEQVLTLEIYFQDY